MRGQRLSCWVAGRPRWSLLRVWRLRWGWPLMPCGWSVMTWAGSAAAATRSGSFSTRARRRW